MAPVRGWISRAERLLEGQGETPVHAWLAVVRNYERLLSGDFQSARQWARRAIDVGAKCDPAAAAVGRIAEARSIILAGDVSQGLGLLNEAAVAMVSGELDPLFTGLVYCELVCAFQGLAQYDQAEEWTVAMERWCRGQPDREPPRTLPCPPRRDPQAARPLRRGGRGSASGLRGASALPAPRTRVAADGTRPHPAAHGRPRGRGSGIPRRTRSRMGPAARPRARASGQGDVALAVATIRQRRARQSAHRPVQGVAAEYRAAPRAPARGTGRDRGDGGRPRDGPRGSRRACGSPPGSKARRSLRAPRSRMEGCDSRTATRWTANGSSPKQRDSGTKSGHPMKLLSHAWALPKPSGRRQRAPGRDRAKGGARGPRRNRSRTADGHSRAVRGREGTDDSPAPRSQRLLSRGRLLVAGVRGTHCESARPQGDALPRRLLAHPSRELDAFRRESSGLVTWSGQPVAELPRAALGGNAGAMLDARAKSAYRRRLTEIEDDIEQSRALGDTERESQADAEREFLVRELSRAVGLGGRDRRASSASERARVGVTRAIRYAMTRIGEHHPLLGAHLSLAIRTGTYCGYLPDPHRHRVETLTSVR